MDFINNFFKPAFGQNEVRADIFSRFFGGFQSERAGGWRGWGRKSARSSIFGGEIGSNFFVNTPPIGICPIFGQKFQNSPTSFGLKFKFFGF
jgi:hypothetical protein